MTIGSSNREISPVSEEVELERILKGGAGYGWDHNHYIRSLLGYVKWPAPHQTLDDCSENVRFHPFPSPECGESWNCYSVSVLTLKWQNGKGRVWVKSWGCVCQGVLDGWEERRVTRSKALCGIIIINFSEMENGGEEENRASRRNGDWELAGTSNQTPSERFGEIFVKLACVNCGPFTCEGKNDPCLSRIESKGEAG